MTQQHNNDDTPSHIPPITEDDIAAYLSSNAGFFERHAEVLHSVQIASPHGNRAVSLQERQAEMLREKIKTLEQRIIEMVRHGSENAAIADKVQQWSAALLREREPQALPVRIVEDIRTRFDVPQAALRVWDVAERWREYDFAQGASEDVKVFAASLATPFVGANLGFEPLQWLADGAAARSVALLPLRDSSRDDPAGAGPAFGLLVLGSPDPQRFDAGLGTDFLERMAALASAALQRLR
ncbi:DUF484 family protein [Xylophilus sp.]|uniref:DUF484 family protein n=1 Tax=Xylophilus sp. TaxID=2653893 RepID=UPI0013BB413C|nr:DUF484 family protein [Xylophilus sp.]KAF1048980.1 MAG: hypothetical protein GAK38_01095 [Xylophilus sp.]